jgi:hypothetical protein
LKTSFEFVRFRVCRSCATVPSLQATDTSALTAFTNVDMQSFFGGPRSIADGIAKVSVESLRKACDFLGAAVQRGQPAPSARPVPSIVEVPAI